MNDLVGFYLRISYYRATIEATIDYMNIERLMPCSKKRNSHLKKVLSSNNKTRQQSMTSSRCKYNAQYNIIFNYL